MASNLFIIFIISITMMFHHGLIYGKGLDQAGRLKALRRAKMGGAARSEFEYGGEWAVLNADGESENTSMEEIEGGDMEDDLIKGGLPGQPSNVMFKQYSGYVNVDKSKGRNLFYYFAEAIHDPSSKPLVLWLNGGPGCSSLGEGAMVEVGPFGVNSDGKTLYQRRYSWNRVANTLFLESPAGVGFSYSNSTSDYNITGDKSTARDTYTFLINWFKRFSHYKNKDFFIMGESYAGTIGPPIGDQWAILLEFNGSPVHAVTNYLKTVGTGFYIPELADTIVMRNKLVGSSSVINLKGIMIGNGVMNDITDEKGCHDYYWTHALISDETYQGLIQYCRTTNYNQTKCEYFEDKVGEEAGAINFYNIYSPVCLVDNDSSSFSKKIKNQKRGGFDPCDGEYVNAYLNLPQVQQALHANITKLPYAWDVCSDVLNSWNDSPSTMFPLYKRLISSGLRIRLFSGDVDAVVPVSGTRYSIDALNLTVLQQWHPWFDDTKQVAGYQVVYKELTFTTVRGAGHEVPRYQPRRALTLLQKFLAGK